MPEKIIKSKADRISCLYEITQAIHATLDLRKSLYKVLDLLSEHLSMKRGSITLLDPEKSVTHIELAHGISQAEMTRGRYKLGEGITGSVIESGRPMAVPNIDDEPLFLDKTRARSRIDKSKSSFICVPIKEGNRVIVIIDYEILIQTGFFGISPEKPRPKGVEGPDEHARRLRDHPFHPSAHLAGRLVCKGHRQDFVG